MRTLKDTELINEPSESPQRLRIFYYLSLCNKVLGFLLITLVIAWILKFRGGFFSNNFNWHPLFMILGMVFVYSRGMLFYRTERTIGMSRLRVMYARLFIGGLIFIITGIFAGFEKNDIAESMETIHCFSCMFTLHSWVGLASLILFFCQCVADFFSTFHPGINQYLQTTYARWYVYLAMGSFVAAIAASLLGFNEIVNLVANEGGDYKPENIILWFIYTTLITFGILSLYLFSRDSYKRLARPEDDALLSKSLVFKHLCWIPWSFHECTYSLRMVFSRTHSSTVLATVDTRSPAVV